MKKRNRKTSRVRDTFLLKCMEDARGISRQQLRKDRSGTSSGYEGDRRRCGDERAGRFPEELWMRLSAGILFFQSGFRRRV